jgi:hypothetical protein
MPRTKANQGREPRTVRLKKETLRSLDLASLTDDQLRAVLGGGLVGCKYTCDGC